MRQLYLDKYLPGWLPGCQQRPQQVVDIAQPHAPGLVRHERVINLVTPDTVELSLEGVDI